MNRSKVLYFIGFLWLLGVGLSFYTMYDFSNTPGKVVELAPQWPEQSQLKRVSGQPTFLLFIHPKCSCSRATLEEFERMLPHFENKALVKVIFIQPSGRSLAWVEDDLWSKVQLYKNVESVIDRDGKESQIFRATTSGQSYLYDAEGSLVFSGGLTPSRGHQGNSVGQKFVVDWLEKQQKETLISKFFGCGLFGRANGE